MQGPETPGSEPGTHKARQLTSVARLSFRHCEVLTGMCQLLGLQLGAHSLHPGGWLLGEDKVQAVRLQVTRQADRGPGPGGRS